MKKIEAIIKPFKLSAVKEILHEIGLSGMTVIEVKGFGRQRGQDGLDQNQDYSDEFHAKVKIEIIVEDDIVKKAIDSIQKAAYSEATPWFTCITEASTFLSSWITGVQSFTGYCICVSAAISNVDLGQACFAALSMV